MSCAFRDNVSIDTTIKSRRLPSPIAATGHVLKRTLTSNRWAIRVIRSLTRDAGHSHPVKGGDLHQTKPQRHGWAPRQERQTSPINRMVLSAARLLTL